MEEIRCWHKNIVDCICQDCGARAAIALPDRDQPSSAASEPISAESAGDVQQWGVGPNGLMRPKKDGGWVEHFVYARDTAELRQQLSYAMEGLRIRQEQFNRMGDLADKAIARFKSAEAELDALKASIPEKAQRAAEEISAELFDSSGWELVDGPGTFAERAAAILTRIFGESHG